MADTYNDSSIKALKGADRVRLRPGVMLGSDDLKGAFHTFNEILGNSLDESRGGFGNVIDVVLYKDGAISVEDRGRGVPMGWNEAEQAFNWKLVFDELYAGGKYDDTEYKFSLGLNGLGATAVQYTSAYMDVVVHRDGKEYEIHFKAGNADGDLIEKDVDPETPTGTFIKWKPDDEVFSNTNITFQMLYNYCESQAHINTVTIRMRDESNPNNDCEIEGKGIEYYLCSQVGESKIKKIYTNADSPASDKEINGKDTKGKPYNAKLEYCLAITEECRPVNLYYHNTATVQGGVHYYAINGAFSDFFKRVSQAKGINLQPSDYEGYFSLVASTYSNITSFANQTKDSVNNTFIRDLIYRSLSNMLNLLYDKQDPMLMAVCEAATAVAFSRKAAKEAEMVAKKVKKVTQTKKQDPIKYKDCFEKNPSKRELYIVEGDSALGSCKDSRDSNFQALIPIRGKSLNCLKADLTSILKNQEIIDIISLIGTGIEVGNTAAMFNINNLKFDKIIICTDADVDGYQIRVLLYTLFYVLMPKIIEDGHLYVVETPLFELECANQDSLFAYTVEEKDKLLKECHKKGIKVLKVNRSKGLGENTPEMMKLTTMSPETRRLKRIKFDTKNIWVQKATEMLFGSDPTGDRRECILNMFGRGAADLLTTAEGVTEAEAMEDLETLATIDAEMQGTE